MPTRIHLNWIIAGVLAIGLLVSIFASSVAPFGVSVGVCIAGVFVLSIADVVRNG